MRTLLMVAAVAAMAFGAMAQELAPKKVAVFVQNRTKVAGMDDEMDGIRDRLAAAIAGTGELEVVDSAFSVDTFRRWKITTEEEKSGLISGIFSGGSAPNVAKMLNCDYIAAATVVGATAMNRNMNGRLAKVFTLRMTLKVMDATGASVFAMPPWTRRYPVVDAADDPINYYNILIDQWSEEAGAAVANSSSKWRLPDLPAAALVTVHFATTIDETIAELESQTKGATGEQLVELRRVCGGATVEIDGAVIGSAPGDFKIAPGLHQLKVSREWMKPYTATINVTDGMVLKVALEMSEEGLAKWGSTEALRAELAKRYAEAAMTRGIKLNYNLDTTNWQDVSTGVPTQSVILK